MIVRGTPPAAPRSRPSGRARAGYTLVELLITVSIIGIMASMVLFALFSAQEQARVQKTRTLITKLDNIIRARWEAYRTRRVQGLDLVDDEFRDNNQNGVWDGPHEPLIRDNNNNGSFDYTARQRATFRLEALRDIMRMELPDRWSDVYDDVATPFSYWNNGLPQPIPTLPRPSVFQAYRLKYAAVTGQNAAMPLTADATKNEYQNAECLYMIVMAALAQDGDARETFKPDQVGDVDEDGFPEFIDAWGTPIRFLRWAPGFISDLQNPIRGVIDQIGGSGQLVTIEAVGNQFPRSAGEILGGALAVLHRDGTTERINTRQMGRITGYVYDEPTRRATFTLTTPSYTMQDVFADMPQNGDHFVLMPPDPLDPRGAYPIYSTGSNPPSPDTSVPTYALYPLIYSAGPDKVFGITLGTGSTTFSYTANVLNPYTILPPGILPFGLMMGSYASSDSTEDGFYDGCWNDNIHNHQLNVR